MELNLKAYFSDFFEIDSKVIESYGAFDISLINDLPLFIDPFLIFNSKKSDYQLLHQGILKYLRFLREKAQSGFISDGLLKSWYQFPEIKQNWFGFCENGNGGRGLGREFALALHTNLNALLSNFGNESITESSHLEKLTLIKDKVGKDNISDFCTNLIHDYLLQYTQKFTLKYLDEKFIRQVAINNVRFNYQTETWETETFRLPYYNGEYILLTPIDMLTKDDTWINKTDIVKDFTLIPEAMPNNVIRDQINNYFYSMLPKEPTAKDKAEAVGKVMNEYPEFIDYYIKYKELNGELAVSTSIEKVKDSITFYIEQFKQLIQILNRETDFYHKIPDSFEESFQRVLFLKNVVENNDGYRIFYNKGVPIKKEQDLQIMYRLTWFATTADVNREVNNGRGPVDFKVSNGKKDKTLIEFKLASNSQLRRNLQNQVGVYEKANDSNKSIKVILYFSEQEFTKVTKILNDLGLQNNPKVVLIDARDDNKPSASTAS